MRPAPETPTAPFRGLQFLIEPKPWLRVFTRNIGDLFRSPPPPVWITAKPSAYWPDALVHRPVAWGAARQSFLLHILVALAIYGINLAWLNQPQVIQRAPVTTSPLHYELSQYLPAVTPRASKPAPPRRARPQKADPEYAVQEIIVTHENHISTRQTIVQPNPMLLKQDVPLPNLIVSTPVPGAPMASNHRLRELPLNAPQIAPPATQVAQSGLHPLAFPPAVQPVTATPSGPVIAKRPTRVLPLEGPVVVPPSPETATRNNTLPIPVQAPPEAEAPASAIAASRPLRSMPLPMTAPQVAPPSPAAAGRNLSNLGLPLADHTANAAPAQPVSSGGSAREKELGQLLVLNAQPVAPVAPVTMPEGNRPGEFAASPEGHPGATARPEIKAGNSTPAAIRPEKGVSLGEIYVSPPPAKITSNAVMSVPHRPVPPDRTEGQPRDRIDTQIFGTRRHYSMRLSMPNLSSSVGSWTVRFAELNATGPGSADLSAPEAISKVDPAYPQDLMHDRIEGVVVLYAIIRSDGTVDGVRVLEGIDERLNENARKALRQWRFRPGTKDGTPIDIEAVVRVPFKVPRNSF
ncbi:MAG TPA: TonB family protein [Candidatus Sulfotelmatobacter sp.]|nr:TonB family protein [Candidatus Sulfotelmatobacter sp.]